MSFGVVVVFGSAMLPATEPVVQIRTQTIQQAQTGGHAQVAGHARIGRHVRADSHAKLPLHVTSGGRPGIGRHAEVGQSYQFKG